MIGNHKHVNLHARGRFAVVAVCLNAWLVASAVNARAAELLVGTATTSITPEDPIAQIGSFHLRVAETVESPLTASHLPPAVGPVRE